MRVFQVYAGKWRSLLRMQMVEGGEREKMERRKQLQGLHQQGI